MLQDTFLLIYIPVLLWSIGIVILIALLARKYTFGAWTNDNPNPYQAETFGMPRGVMRGVLTLSLLFIVMLMEVVNLRVSGLEQLIEKLLVAFQMMLAFYFGSKVMHHVTSADRSKTKAVSEAMTSVKAGQPQPQFSDSEAHG